MAINTTAESLLAQVRAYQDQIAASRPSGIGQEQSTEIRGPSFSQQFSEAMVDTLREVSDVQQSATALSEAYQAGEDAYA